MEANTNITKEEEEEEKGYVHIYTGNGKGKTTTAFGLAVWALMVGKKVFIGQFVNSMKYHDIKLEPLMEGRLCIKQYGNGCFIYKNEPTTDDKTMAIYGLADCERILLSGSGYNMVILDELTIALRYKLLEIADVVRIISERYPKVEVVVTGRDAPEELIAI
jgi:cob(I)alamin adenosyltransferase